MARPNTVMVVDYDPTVASLIEEVLLFEGYTLCPLQRNQLSLAAIERANPDLLIVDLPLERPEETVMFAELLRHTAGMWQLGLLMSTTSVPLFHMMAEPLAKLRCQILLKPFTLEMLFEGIRLAKQLVAQTDYGDARVSHSEPASNSTDGEFE